MRQSLGAGAALPVVWATSLALASQRDVATRLATPTPDSLEAATWTVRCTPDGACTPVDTVHTTTCRQYWDARTRGLAGTTAVDVGDLLTVGARCAAIEAIGRAGTPKQSAVRSFTWSPADLDSLPANLALAVTAVDSARLWRAAEAGATLRRVDPGLRATVDHQSPGDTALVVESSVQQLRIELLARGDFDGDGWDDMLVRVVAGARGGSFATQHVHVLSRRRAGVPLSVVRQLW